jgi:hypothetical protein
MKKMLLAAVAAAFLATGMIGCSSGGSAAGGVCGCKTGCSCPHCGGSSAGCTCPSK